MFHQQENTPSKTAQKKSGFNLQKSYNYLSMKLKDVESQLTVIDALCRDERKLRIKAETERDSFKKEICQLEQGLDYYQRHAETQKSTIQTFEKKLQEKDVLCKDLQKSLNTESKRRPQLEEKNGDKVLINTLQKDIYHLEKGLEYYQNGAETSQKTIQDLQSQLQQKEAFCEEMKNKLTLREQQLNQETVIESLRKELEGLKTKNSELVDELENVYSRKHEAEEKFSKELGVFKLQLEKKSFLCKKLETSLDEEKKLRDSFESELDKNRAVICENSDLKQEIRDLKQTNSDLRDVLDKNVSEKVDSDKMVQELQKLKQALGKEQEIRQGMESELIRHTETARLNDELLTKVRALEETESDLQRIIVDLYLGQNQANGLNEQELEILTQQLQVELNSELQPGSDEPQTLEETNVMLDSENSNSVCQTDPSPIDEFSPKAVPQPDRRQKISTWRRFKKFLTPACLRKHKDKS